MAQRPGSNVSFNVIGSDEENVSLRNAKMRDGEKDFSDSSTAPSSVSTSTHDTSRTSYHIKDLTKFAENVKQAAERAFPNVGQSRYGEVVALLLYWEEDNLQVDTEIRALRKVFRDSYGFAVEVFKIPSRESQIELASEIISIVRHYNIEDDLLIVYYGGHGGMDNSRQASWMCTGEPNSPSVNWSAIQTNFKDCVCDVLFLLDCCAAASATPDSGQGATFETIAACEFETKAPGPGPHSFTNALIEVLKDWRSRNSLITATEGNVRIKELDSSLAVAQSRAATLESERQRLIKERKSALDQYQDLEERFERETKAKKGLEHRLHALEYTRKNHATMPKKGPTNQQNAISPKQFKRPKSMTSIDSKPSSETLAQKSWISRTIFPEDDAASTLPINRVSSRHENQAEEIYNTDSAISGLYGGRAFHGESAGSKPANRYNSPLPQGEHGHEEDKVEKEKRKKEKLDWEEFENERIAWSRLTLDAKSPRETRKGIVEQK